MSGGLTNIGPLWLVGCGAMGGALLARWLSAGLAEEQVTVIDPSPKALPEGARLRVLNAPPAGEAKPAVLVLAIKPQTLPQAAPVLVAATGPDTLIVSILAGVRTETLQALFSGRQIVRAMPNTPARIGRGVTGLYGARSEAAEALMATAGSVYWLEDESQFDALTAMSGSGPAYLFQFIESFAAAGAASGLPPQLAAALARDTVAGAAELAARSDEPPAVLRAQVTSPNGTTQAGLEALNGGGLTQLLEATVAAAAARSRELAEEIGAALT